MLNKFFRYSSKLAAAMVTCCLLAEAALAEDPSNPGSEPGQTITNAKQEVLWNLDQVTAWIPAENAPVPSVALARLNIALYTAKRRTTQSLCSGQWMANGPLYDQQAPTLQHLTTGHAGKPAWFYYALRHPRPIPCGNVSRVRFFREMSRHLPEWVVVRPAGHKTAFRQGGAVFPEQQSVLATR